MTANIRQHITPRHRPDTKRQSWRPSRSFLQYGRINSATLSLGFAIVAIIGVAFLSFFYLGQVVSTASQGTDIQELEAKIVELKEQRKELELEGAGLRSIQTIENQVPELNLVATDKVTYIDSGQGKVARIDN